MHEMRDNYLKVPGEKGNEIKIISPRDGKQWSINLLFNFWPGTSES